MHEKIEAGRWYKTRDGQRVYIIGNLPENGIEVMWAGWVDRKYLTWFSDGAYEPLCGVHSNDLLSLWQEPNEVKLPEKMDIEGIPPEHLVHICNAINDLVDFCESLQARVKELESGIIKREYGG